MDHIVITTLKFAKYLEIFYIETGEVLESLKNGDFLRALKTIYSKVKHGKEESNKYYDLRLISIFIIFYSFYVKLLVELRHAFAP